MANLEELKKLADEKGVELSEEDLEAIAGGMYSREEWKKMTPEERRKAQERSAAARVLGIPCELD